MVSCTHVCAVYQKNKTNMLAKKYPTPFHIPLKLVRKSKSSIMFGCGSKPDNRLSYWISLDVYLPKLFFDSHICLSHFEPIECYLGSLSSTDLFGMRF
jgi:hypothetical protein